MAAPAGLAGPEVESTPGPARAARPPYQRFRVPILIGRRLAGALLSLFGVLVLNFFLFNVLAKDPAKALGHSRHMTAAAEADLDHRFGFDKPLMVQFWDYLDRLVLHFDLGESLSYTSPVTTVIGHYVWPTVLLVGLSTVLSSALGTWMGIKGAWQRGTVFDKVSNSISVTLYAMPEFWLGILLVLFLAGDTVGLGIFPTGGMSDVNTDMSTPAGWANVAWHLTLPCITLTLAYLAQYSLVVRSSMLDEMGQDYVMTARAKGLRDLAVRRRHVVPNAMLPAITQIFLYFGFVISGALTVEYVFTWPGLGTLTENAVSSIDLPLLRGLFLLFTASVIFFNLVADLLLGILDPRVRDL